MLNYNIKINEQLDELARKIDNFIYFRCRPVHEKKFLHAME